MSNAHTDDPLAQIAVEPIEDGMIVGLGTGRAASRGVVALGQRARQERLSLICVATSNDSEDLAREVGLTVRPMREIARVDYLFDGADEVDPELRMLKGGGGAMTREKIVARAATRRVYMIQREKLVTRLASRMPLPIEILPFALASVRAGCEQLGLIGEMRRAKGAPSDDPLYRTDNTNLVLDAHIPSDADINALARALDAMAGVVGHGLFVDEADTVHIEDETGAIETRTRAD